MRTVDSYNFSGKRALVRVDFNVPLNENNEITDDTRMRAALPTIKKILADGGAVVLMSHLGRPLKKLRADGSVDIQKFTLRHLVIHLSELLHIPVQFSPDCIGENTIHTARQLQKGEVLLVENTRFHPEEEKGEEAFAAELAKLGEVYINDAFGSAHRAHASTTIVAKYFRKEDTMFGKLMADEIIHARKVMEETKRPFTAIIGGAKVSGKIDIIENLLQKADNIIIGGGMAYTFFKAMGQEVGSSLVEDDKLEMAGGLLKKAALLKVNLLLPFDSVIADQFDNGANRKVAPNTAIPSGWMGLDIGPESVRAFREVIMASQTILWNGPMGVFEMSHFRNGTAEIAKAVADATAKGAFSLVGGGDSVAAVNQLGYADKISYISTGGGAMLEFFEGKTLPGVEVLL